MREHCNPLHDENYTADDYDGPYPWTREMDLENRRAWWNYWTGTPKAIDHARRIASLNIAQKRIFDTIAAPFEWLLNWGSTPGNRNTITNQGEQK